MSLTAASSFVRWRVLLFKKKEKKKPIHLKKKKKMTLTQGNLRRWYRCPCPFDATLWSMIPYK